MKSQTIPALHPRRPVLRIEVKGPEPGNQKYNTDDNTERTQNPLHCGHGRDCIQDISSVYYAAPRFLIEGFESVISIEIEFMEAVPW
jgi:hypothetical protein